MMSVVAQQRQLWQQRHAARQCAIDTSSFSIAVSLYLLSSSFSPLEIFL